MLTKHPGRRMRWPDICAHPFWRGALPVQPTPPQPDFEAFLAAHYPPDEPDSEVHLSFICILARGSGLFYL